MTRKFTIKDASREAVSLMVGLVGPSGSGKTYSALELATGIQSVSGGDIYFIDSEGKRALHYATKFKFKHIDFEAPFAPGDYLDCFQQCVAAGAKTIIVDSMSHEHEGPGGVLEMHEAELDRMVGADEGARHRSSARAWIKPKSERRRLINSMLQMRTNFILCFRAQEKLKFIKGGNPEPLGWMPIAGSGFIYESTMQCLLPPGAEGYPDWNPELPGERAMVKLPEQFRPIFLKKDPVRLTADVGRQLAVWAAGSPAPSPTVPKIDDLIASYETCSDEALYTELERDRQAVWDKLTTPQKAKLKALSAKVDERLRAQVGA